MINALDDLIAKVEAGAARPADFRCLEVPMQDMRYTEMPNSARMAYKGSLDAAKALHEAALTGWNWQKLPDGTFHLMCMDTFNTASGHTNDNPARAWLIAILRAMREGKDA